MSMSVVLLVILLFRWFVHKDKRLCVESIKCHSLKAYEKTKRNVLNSIMIINGRHKIYDQSRIHIFLKFILPIHTMLV